MMMKTNLQVLCLLLIGLNYQCKDKKNLFEVKVLQIDSTNYSYEIFYAGSIFIKQEFIPAIPCKKHFLTKKQALRTGELVVKKINAKKNPSISLEELIEQGIDTKCVDLPVNRLKD